MDGLTIGKIQSALGNGELSSTVGKAQKLNTPSLDPVSGIQPEGTSFVDSLKNAIQNTNEIQKNADVKMQELATGKSQNIHETMIAVEKADIALRMMLQVRNKIIEAYQEVMKMQV